MENNKMGEEACPNDVENESSDEQDESDNEQDINGEEYAAIDGMLDALNNALDSMEKKNDDLYAQLIQLLKENKEIRQEIQNDNNEEMPLEQK